MKIFTLFVMTALLPVIAIGGIAFLLSTLMARLIDLSINKAPVPVEVEHMPVQPSTTRPQ